jgi:tripartite-type tricarboxylate transporter receptor subunit TctC
VNKRCFLQWSALAATATAWPTVRAQSFPDRPVRVIVPFAGGNTLDTALRQVAEVFRTNTGQPMIVDNRPGGSGFIAAQAVMQAPPDGYTLLMPNTSMLAINPHTFAKLPYDPERSFRHVSGFVGASMVMAVHAGVPARDLREFVDWARTQPSVSYASFTAGNSSHFAGVLLNQRTGLQMVHVPHNGTPPAVQNLLGAHVHAAFLPLLAVKPHVDAGKVRVLAVTSPQRSPMLPDVATFREQGYPDLEIYIWSSIAAPAGTPDPIVERLHAEFVRAMRTPEVRDKWRAMDFETLTMPTDELQRFIAADSKRWAEAVRISGFKASE